MALVAIWLERATQVMDDTVQRKIPFSWLHRDAIEFDSLDLPERMPNIQ